MSAVAYIPSPRQLRLSRFYGRPALLARARAWLAARVRRVVSVAKTVDAGVMRVQLRIERGVRRRTFARSTMRPYRGRRLARPVGAHRIGALNALPNEQYRAAMLVRSRIEERVSIIRTFREREVCRA